MINVSQEFIDNIQTNTDFKEKFGIPRQSGLVESLVSRIVFEPEYRNPDAFRGIEGYSHLWLLWHFSEADRGAAWSPTVRPPRLGGNTRVGVFATRSPFRPNNLGLSCVKLERVEKGKNGVKQILFRFQRTCMEEVHSSHIPGIRNNRPPIHVHHIRRYDDERTGKGERTG